MADNGPLTMDGDGDSLSSILQEIEHFNRNTPTKRRVTGILKEKNEQLATEQVNAEMKNGKRLSFAEDNEEYEKENFLSSPCLSDHSAGSFLSPTVVSHNDPSIEIIALKRELKSRKKAYKTLENSYKSIKETSKRLKIEFNNQKSIRAQLVKENASIKSTLESQIHENQILATTNSELKNEVLKSTQQVKRLEESIQSKEQELKSIKQELDNEKEKNQSYLLHIDNLTNQNEMALSLKDKQIKELEQEVCTLKQSVEDVVAIQQKEFNRLLEETYESQKASYENLMLKNKEELMNTLVVPRDSELKLKQEEIEVLRMKLELMKKEAEEKSTTMEELKGQLDSTLLNVDNLQIELLNSRSQEGLTQRNIQNSVMDENLNQGAITVETQTDIKDIIYQLSAENVMERIAMNNKADLEDAVPSASNSKEVAPETNDHPYAPLSQQKESELMRQISVLEEELEKIVHDNKTKEEQFNNLTLLYKKNVEGMMYIRQRIKDLLSLPEQDHEDMKECESEIWNINSLIAQIEKLMTQSHENCEELRCQLKEQEQEFQSLLRLEETEVSAAVNYFTKIIEEQKIRYQQREKDLQEQLDAKNSELFEYKKLILEQNTLYQQLERKSQEQLSIKRFEISCLKEELDKKESEISSYKIGIAEQNVTYQQQEKNLQEELDVKNHKIFSSSKPELNDDEEVYKLSEVNVHEEVATAEAESLSNLKEKEELIIKNDTNSSAEIPELERKLSEVTRQHEQNEQAPPHKVEIDLQGVKKCVYLIQEAMKSIPRIYSEKKNWSEAIEEVNQQIQLLCDESESGELQFLIKEYALRCMTINDLYGDYVQKMEKKEQQFLNYFNLRNRLVNATASKKHTKQPSFSNKLRRRLHF
jgi:hypothetical protein